jgi:hypothetical protein
MNAPSNAPSPQGRRVLIAIVTGEPGERIQEWRREHDPQQALRLPPHATLCYWAPNVAPDVLKKQVRHAFREPVSVRLGAVKEFDNEEETFYVEVLDTDALDRARRRLYDGEHVELPLSGDWTWHVSCIRDSRGRDKEALRLAARRLELDAAWRIETVAYMELRGERYEAIAVWGV